MIELERLFFWKRHATTAEIPDTPSLGVAIEVLAVEAEDRGARAAPLSKSYRDYINSDEWKSKRRQKLHSRGYCCERCGRRRYLAVHHRHYRTFGREGMEDLEVVCQDCHQKADKERRRKVSNDRNRADTGRADIGAAGVWAGSGTRKEINHDGSTKTRSK